MAWGKEEFRTKYKESNDCLEKIKDNYRDLDREYQIIAWELQQKENIIKEVRKYIKEHTLYDDKFPMLPGDIKELLEILDKEKE